MRKLFQLAPLLFLAAGLRKCECHTFVQRRFFCLFLHWNPLYGHQYITDSFVVQRVTNSHVSLIRRYGQFICTLSMTEYLTGDNLTHFCFSLYIDKICDGDVFSESPLSTDTMACFLGVRINQVSILHF